MAVKRLSNCSSQGFPELKNELVLAAKLKHRNLAPIIGACLQEEKLLIYEYMPNSSLDTFLFGNKRNPSICVPEFYNNTAYVVTVYIQIQ
jgi:hypothetical protein